MEEMKGRISGVNLAYYVNMRTLQAVHQALDIPLSKTIDTTAGRMNGYRWGDGGGGGGHAEEEGDIVEEEVPMYNDDLWLAVEVVMWLSADWLIVFLESVKW